MNNIEAVIFDLDGVMIDTERIWLESMKKYCKLNNLPLDDNFFYSIVGFRADDTLNAIKEKLDGKVDLKKFDECATKIMDDTIMREGLVHKKGLDELLAFLKSKKIKIGLATSSYRSRMEFKLKFAGIDINNFDCIVTGEVVEKSKPDPQIYTIACQKLNVLPENAFAIEDSPIGVQSAYFAGLKPICIPDIAKISDEISALAYRKFDSLDKIIGLFD